MNRITLTDSYKFSHSVQYPVNTTYMFDYIEARSNKIFPETIFFGLQYFLKKYFEKPIEQWEVDEAFHIAQAHGVPFDKEGWDYIVRELQGRLPLKIRAVKEGSVIPTGNILVSVESTDSKVFWVVGFFETLLLKVWYPTTVATKSFFVRKIIDKFQATEPIDFKYHNFGDRGSSSVETASIGGMAHLTSFLGTDNFNALKDASKYYSSDIAGFSIPASEHSTVTSWGKENRFSMYDNYIETFKDYPIVACVMDSYDIYKDVDYVTKGEFKTKIESENYPIFVIRPDSGEPIEVLSKLLKILEDNKVGFSIQKGLKVFNKYRFIWGDGISPEKIEEILSFFEDSGYSIDNISFGSGGDLMQNINRDTMGFAMKCSAIEVDGKIRNVFKDPVTDKGKKSKKGILDLYFVNGEYVTAERGTFKDSLMETVFLNGDILRSESFEEIRKRVQNH
jgi:nicotinamide phosphoribosyltransferase